MVKQLWVLVGGNGSGKSTFYDRYLKNRGLAFVNADIIAKKLSEKISDKVSKSAQTLAMEISSQKIENNESFCFETVFSHSSKLELIKKAKQNGYEVNLVFIHLKNPELNIARVYQRVESGGHAVPHEKIVKRIPRLVKNVIEAIPIVDKAVIIDNSSTQDPLKILVKIAKGKIIFKEKNLPEWAVEIIKKI